LPRHIEHAWFRDGGALVDDGAGLTVYTSEWKPAGTFPLPARETGTTRVCWFP
jgi:hypothetical protein